MSRHRDFLRRRLSSVRQRQASMQRQESLEEAKELSESLSLILKPIWAKKVKRKALKHRTTPDDIVNRALQFYFNEQE